MNKHYPRISSEISEQAIRGMLLEIACTPKPGLVDRRNNGANNDMDFPLFCLSSASICHDLYSFAMLGLDSDESDEVLLQKLRFNGMETEKRMFSATGGINTQKGLIFILGIICASAGRLVSQGILLCPETLSRQIKIMTSGICAHELLGLNRNPPGRELTKGESLYVKYGARGIRGETENGLPTVIEHGLPELRAGLSDGLTLNDSMVNALLRIMSVAEDTNVIARSSYETLKNKVQPLALEALELGGFRTVKGREFIYKMDELFISQNINPGGSADLLAATVTIHFLENTGIL